MSAEPAPQSLRIFIVDNHQDTLRSLEGYLNLLGHTVVCATSLREAREKLPTADCDVLISDIGLTDGTGWELLETLELPRPIFAIALSGYGMDEDRKRSLKAGFRHHLVKPSELIQLDQLLATAARELENREK